MKSPGAELEAMMRSISTTGFCEGCSLFRAKYLLTQEIRHTLVAYLPRRKCSRRAGMSLYRLSLA